MSDDTDPEPPTNREMLRRAFTDFDTADHFLIIGAGIGIILGLGLPPVALLAFPAIGYALVVGGRLLAIALLGALFWLLSGE